MGTFTIFVFFVTWFVYSCASFGLSVPSGVFGSSVVLGCSIGFLYENLRVMIFGDEFS